MLLLAERDEDDEHEEDVHVYQLKKNKESGRKKKTVEKEPEKRAGRLWAAGTAQGRNDFGYVRKSVEESIVEMTGRGEAKELQLHR